MNKIKNNLLLKFLSLLMILISSSYIYTSFLDNYNELVKYNYSINYVFTMLSICFFVLAVPISGFLWHSLFREGINTKNTILMYMKIWSLKYIPGQIGTSIGKINWGNKNNIEKKTVLKKILEEHAYITTSSLLLSLPLIYYLNSYLSLIYLFSFFLFLFLIYFIFRSVKSMNQYFNELNKILSNSLKYCIPRLSNGIGFLFICLSITTARAEHIFLTPFIFIWSSIIGLLAILVPGGIGVREAVLIYFLNFSYEMDDSIVISIFSRVINIISDVLTSIISIIIKNKSL